MDALSLFSQDRLPRKPFCSDRPGADLIRSLSHALKYPYMQVNGPALKYWMIFDNDYEGSAFAWEDAGIAEPNFTVINPVNGHSHMLYGLLIPLVTSANGRTAPLRYAGAIEAGYTARLRADIGYSKLITKNPIHPRWRTISGPQWAYDLDELASYLPDISKLRDKRRRHIVGIGRNVTLFDRLRNWAYRNIKKTAWMSRQAWTDAVYIRATYYNDFPAPLWESEVRAIARSVAKWVWFWLRGSQADYVSRTHTSEIQAIRGRKGGIASGDKRRKGTALEQDRQPWVKLGISRATWYRRRKNETEA